MPSIPWKRLLLLTAVLAAAATISTAASAQKKGGVIRLEETVIEGRVQKPNAFFINTRAPIGYTAMEIKESFVAEIAEAVRKGPF